jgi:plastocyanin
MNLFTNFIIFIVLLPATGMVSTNIFSNDIFAQMAVTEIMIGPDPSKDGDDVYNPDALAINEGDKVVWLNKDFGIHTVTENQGLFGSNNLRPDQMFEYIFDDAGTYDYHCKLHPEMVGKIIVR